MGFLVLGLYGGFKDILSCRGVGPSSADLRQFNLLGAAQRSFSMALFYCRAQLGSDMAQLEWFCDLRWLLVIVGQSLAASLASYLMD